MGSYKGYLGPGQHKSPVIKSLAVGTFKIHPFSLKHQHLLSGQQTNIIGVANNPQLLLTGEQKDSYVFEKIKNSIPPLEPVFDSLIRFPPIKYK